MMNNENGRSMVEMLGVLAIIGVLSVAGIAGYSMAMKKYKANEIVNAASQLVVLAQANFVAGKLNASSKGEATTADLGGSGYKVAGYEMKAECSGTTANSCTVSHTSGTAGEGSAWEAAQTQASGTYYTISSQSKLTKGK